jgi:hypothetical protein
MNDNRNKLALRRQSIRILSEDEMRMARAGSGNTQKTSHRPTHPF